MQFKEIENFFTTMPKLSHSVTFTNPKTDVEKHCSTGRVIIFFRVGMVHMDLENYYKLNFSLMQYHKYSLTEIENLIPWERDIYVGMLQQYLEDERLKQQQASS